MLDGMRLKHEDRQTTIKMKRFTVLIYHAESTEQKKNNHANRQLKWKSEEEKEEEEKLY